MKATTEANRAKFAIECRNIRLWLSSNPGATSFEIKQAVGGRTDMALSKMLGMEIIKCVHERTDAGRRIEWFVVPQ
jgi:hypothetical protein